MKTLNLVQGSAEWLQHRNRTFNASEAAAMLGFSKHQSRNALLKQKYTGLTVEVDASTQRVFDRGHDVEAKARPIVEKIIGDELYAVTGEADCFGLPLLASFDGLTLDDETVWENKQWNGALATYIAENNDLPDTHWPQAEQQLMVSKASRLYFTVSDGTEEGTVGIWYQSKHDRKNMLIAGWLQFKKDLDAYQPEEKKQAAEGAPAESFPVPTIQVRGELVACNLADLTPHFDKFLTETKTKLETDQDFADGEVNAKASREAAKNLKLTAKAVVDQIAPVSEVVRTLELYADKFDKLGLTLEKAVKEQKEAIKARAIGDAIQDYRVHLAALEMEIGVVRIIHKQPDFASAIKGVKTLETMQERIDTALTHAKIEVDAIAKDLRGKLAWMARSDSARYEFLFADLQQVIYKDEDDFKLLVASRINAHREAESKRKAEEEAKAAEEAIKARATQQDQPVDLILPKAAEPAPVVDLQQAVVEHQDDISSFMASRNFGKEANKVRAILVEFVKWQAGRGMKQAA